MHFFFRTFFFFFSTTKWRKGVGIRISVLVQGLLHWKLCLVSQSVSLGLSPLFAYALTTWIGTTDLLDPLLLDGLLVVSAVPTTISSAYIITGAMRGNVGAALFNCAFGNFLGVFITPLWLFALLSSRGSVAIGSTLGRLALTMVVPTLVGLLLQKIFERQLLRIERRLSTVLAIVNKFALFLIVYFAFCDTFSQEWTVSGEQMVLLFLCNFALFVTLCATAGGAAKLLRFERADVVACVNCGAQKTLAIALPLITIFATNPGVVAVQRRVFKKIFLNAPAGTARNFVVPPDADHYRWPGRRRGRALGSSRSAPHAGQRPQKRFCRLCHRE